MPGVVVACRLGLHTSVAVVDCEVQGYHAVAAYGILLSIGGGGS